MIEIVMKPIGDLHVYERNARTHSEAQVLQIMESIKEFGWTNPVLVDEADVVIAGHGRLLAARRLQLVEVPTIILRNLTDAQKRAYRIADNKLPLNSGWDDALLKLELMDLREMDFNLENIGFGIDEIKNIFAEQEGSEIPALNDLMPDGSNNILIKISVPASVWVGSRTEIMSLLEKMESRYLCTKSVKE